MMNISFRSSGMLFFLLSAIPYLHAQKYSNEFLNIGVGARGQAMGGAISTSVNDATAAYWNPAALANMERKEGINLGLMHTDWFAGISNYDYIGLAFPIQNGKRAVGLSLIRFGIDKIPNTLSLYNSDGSINYDNIREFSAADYAALGTYAQNTKIGDGTLCFGGNAKVIRRKIGTFANSWGFGLDAALQYQKGIFRAGLVIKDLSNTFNSWRFSFTENEKKILQLNQNVIPISGIENTAPSISLGVGMKNKLGNKVALSSEINTRVFTDGKRNTVLSGKTFSVSPSAGLEVGYDNLIFVRAGLSNFQKDNTFKQVSFWTAQTSVGVGLKIRSINLDYAYTNVGSSEARFYSHTISLHLNFKPKSRENSTNEK
ncbi:MAG: PorV/PorQ family protein [Saprospiraceae bacterium]